MLSGGQTTIPRPGIRKRKRISFFQILLWIFGIKCIMFYYVFSRQFALGILEVIHSYKVSHIIGHTVCFLICLVFITTATVIKSHFSALIRPQQKRDFFCTDCQLEVQATTKHCNQCGICIDRFDHHCVWLNLCIGGRNYRLFIATVIVCAITLAYSSLYSLAFCIPLIDAEAVLQSRSLISVNFLETRTFLPKPDSVC